MRKYIRGSVDETLALTTLAARTVVSAPFDESVIERTLVSSIVATYSIRGLTPAGDVGPILVGIAHSDYTAPEIEAVIENTGSWNEGDKVSQEVAGRQIRIIGVFDNPEDALKAVTLNDGKPIRTKLNWILTTGQTLKLFCYNLGESAVVTTVPDVDCQGHANLWPR